MNTNFPQDILLLSRISACVGFSVVGVFLSLYAFDNILLYAIGAVASVGFAIRAIFFPNSDSINRFVPIGLLFCALFAIAVVNSLPMLFWIVIGIVIVAAVLCFVVYKFTHWLVLKWTSRDSRENKAEAFRKESQLIFLTHEEIEERRRLAYELRLSTKQTVPKRKVERHRRKRWSIRIRQEIWHCYGKSCFFCSCEIDNWTGHHMHLDHLYPLSQGGSDNPDNLVPACPECNLEKGKKIFPELVHRHTREKTE